MTIESILALIRHALTTFGGGLVTAGMTTTDDVATASGAVVIVLGFGWSIWRKIANNPRHV